MTYAAPPREVIRHRGVISPMCEWSDLCGPLQGWSGGSAGSQAWPAANIAIGYGFVIPEPVIVYDAWYAAGATAGGNFDIGIFDTAGNLIVNTGSTARVVSAHTNVALTDTTLAVGHYYACMTADGTNNYAGWALAAAGLNEAHGMIEFTDAPPFASTATFAATTRTLIPYFGFTIGYSLGI